MKILAAWLLPLLMLAGSGCLELPRLGRDRKPAQGSGAAATKATRRPTPVTPEQVTEANAHAKADALEQEMAREEQEASSATRPTQHK
jgi:hypothetical protein